jgi:hypothetical protein
MALLFGGILASPGIDVNTRSCAAIAYSPSTGKYEYACDLRSQSAAEKAAVEKLGEPDAKIAGWVKFGFVALALGTDKSCWGAGWTYGHGATDQKAGNTALEDCRKRTTGAYVALIVSSDGQYVWDHRDHITITDKDGNVYDGRGNPISPTPGGNGTSSVRSSSPSPTATPSPAESNLFKALKKNSDGTAGKK